MILDYLNVLVNLFKAILLDNLPNIWYVRLALLHLFLFNLLNLELDVARFFSVLMIGLGFGADRVAIYEAH